MYEPSEMISARLAHQLRAFASWKAAENRYETLWWIGGACGVVMCGVVSNIVQAMF